MNLDENGYPKELPPTWLRIALIAMLLLHFFLPGPVLIPWPYNWSGAAGLVLGAALLLWSGHLFNRAGTGIRPFTPALRLVTGGPFRCSRNPMYLGMVLVLVGTAVMCGELTPWFVVPLFILVIDRRFIAREERFMEQTHGDAWRGYRERVRRWL